MKQVIFSKTIYERSIHVLLGTFSVLVFIYCGVLLSLIFSVIEKKQNSIAIKELRSELSMYETEYANKLTSINDTKLQVEKYVKVDGSTFAVRKADIASYAVLYAR